MNLLLDLRRDHLFGSSAVRARQTRRSSEQPADQRALIVDHATLGAEMRAAQIFKGGGMSGFTSNRQARHLDRRGGDRTTAVVATGNALERRDVSSKVA